MRQSLPRASSSQHRTLPSLVCFRTTWAIAGLELASAVGKLTANDNLIHALAERWESAHLHILGSHGARWPCWWTNFQRSWDCPSQQVNLEIQLEQRFLINVKGLDPKHAVARMTGRKLWPLIKKNGNEYVSLIEIYRQYGAFAEVSSLSRTAREENSACDGSMQLLWDSLSFQMDKIMWMSE